MPEPTPAPPARFDAASFTGRRLRFAIADDGRAWPSWVQRVVAELAAHPRLEVGRIPSALIRPEAPSQSLVRQWFDRLDQRRLTSWLATRGINESPASLPELPCWTATDAAADVIWYLGTPACDTPLPHVPFGVWHYREHDAIHDVFAGKPVTEAVLLASLGHTTHVLGKAEARVHSSSSAITAFQRDEAGARLMLDALERLMHQAWSPATFGEQHVSATAKDRSCAPSSVGMLGLMLSRWLPRVLAARRKSSTRAQWTVGIAPLASEREPGQIRLDQISWLTPPPDSFVADPFLWRHEGQWHVFAEVMPFASGKGHLAVCTWDAVHGFGPLKTVLCEDTHLSYPFLFEHEGRLYLMPERYNGGELCAYECVEFPHRWERARPVKAGLRCADATMLQHEGRWWLFYTAVHGGASEDSLYACFADTPFGPWQPHPLNPLRSGLRGSRMAGGFITKSDGRLLRPAQEASACYGGATILFEVEMLTPHDYREREVAFIDPAVFPPPWNERCHTWNEREGMAVFDACRSL